MQASPVDWPGWPYLQSASSSLIFLGELLESEVELESWDAAKASISKASLGSTRTEKDKRIAALVNAAFEDHRSSCFVITHS